jgi:hypothetical protein
MSQQASGARQSVDVFIVSIGKLGSANRARLRIGRS